MTVAANSYGTAAMVAALTPRYSNNGVFDFTTRPTLAQSETWINQISAMVNVLLAQEGFSIPVTQADCILMLAGLVCPAVAEMAEYSNRAGRFWTDTAQDRALSIQKVLRTEIADWIAANADGMEALGATRSNADLAGAFTMSASISLPYRADSYQDSTIDENDGTP